MQKERRKEETQNEHEKVHTRTSEAAAAAACQCAICDRGVELCVCVCVCCPNTATSVCVSHSKIEQFIESVFHLIWFGMHAICRLFDQSVISFYLLPLFRPLTSSLFFPVAWMHHLTVSLCLLLFVACRHFRLSICVICASDSLWNESCNFCWIAHCPFLWFHSKLCTQNRPVVVVVVFFFITIAPISHAIAHSPNLDMFFCRKWRKNRVIAPIFAISFSPAGSVSMTHHSGVCQLV